MKTKSTIMKFALFAVFSILIAGIASALTFGTPSNFLSVSNKQATVTLTNENITQAVSNIQLSISDIVDGTNSVDLSVTPTSITSLAASASQPVSVSLDNLVGNLKFGTHTTTLTAKSGDNTATSTITFVKSFCSKGSIGDLVINSVEINSDGDEDLEWKPLDEVEVEVEVGNTGTDNIKEIIVELALFDSEGRNKANDLDFENTGDEEIDLGRLNDGDEKTVTFTFRVSPDFEAGDYRLAVKASSDDTGESLQCADISDDLNNDFYQTVDVNREDDEGKFIAFDNIQIKPDQVTCGDTATLTSDIFNIGEDDQDQIKITLFNQELNLNLEKEIRENLDEGDKTDISFTFAVPQGLKDKLYLLDLSADYDYRNGDYKQSSDDSTNTGLKVLGCEVTQNPTQTGKLALITASLISEAKAGQDLNVRSTVTNLGDEADLVVRATGFESWATLNSISDPIIHLRNGESKEITLDFNVDKDATGEQSFFLEVLSGSKSEGREVAVNLAESTAKSPTGLNLQGNSLIWIIGIINVILIILIIVVAARISRK